MNFDRDTKWRVLTHTGEAVCTVRGCVKIQFGSLGFGEVAIKKFIIRNLVEKDNNGDFKSKIAFESDIFFLPFTTHVRHN